MSRKPTGVWALVTVCLLTVGGGLPAWGHAPMGRALMFHAFSLEVAQAHPSDPRRSSSPSDKEPWTIFLRVDGMTRLRDGYVLEQNLRDRIRVRRYEVDFELGIVEVGADRSDTVTWEMLKEAVGKTALTLRDAHATVVGRLDVTSRSEEKPALYLIGFPGAFRVLLVKKTRQDEFEPYDPGLALLDPPGKTVKLTGMIFNPQRLPEHLQRRARLVIEVHSMIPWTEEKEES